MLSVFAEPTAAPVASAAAEGAQQAVESGPMGLITSMLPMILIIVVFYFILIRPQRKRDKENKEMLSNLKVGDEITTIGGIVGKITKIKDDKIMIETGSKTEAQPMLLERWAVRSVTKQITAD
ncbi:MAG: preprotein translocase subunit YajC [Ruminococcaceae bacterium]|nr:preprotein translocase subunit YajC [Oscillospiraceae bacterium]